MGPLASLAAVAGSIVGLAVASPADAHQLLLHFPLDGSPQAFGAAAGTAKVYLAAGGATPAIVPGRHGQALRFDGTATIAMPFSLDVGAYPAVTVTAWVKLDPDSTGERTVFSAGNGNVPKLSVYGDRAHFVAARGSLMFRSGMPRDEWVFVAGVVDVATARLGVHQGDEHLAREGIKMGNLYPPSSYRNPDDPSLPATRYVFVGSHGFKQWRARQMAIDDVRVYAGVLSEEQVAALRTAASVESYASAPTTASSGGPSSTGGPGYFGGVLTDENVADLSEARRGTQPVDITYASEEEALAAAERREREAAEAELARQQNELEAQRRAEAVEEAAGTVAPLPYMPVGDPRFSSVAGLTGETIEMIDLEDQFIEQISLWREWRKIAGRTGWVTCEVGIRGDGGKTLRPTRCMDRGELAIGSLEDAVIGSLSVCRGEDNSGEHRSIKGARITGHHVKDDGTSIFVPAAEQFTFRTGCTSAGWTPRMLCPVEPEHLATGVVAHYRGSTKSQIVGLQLVCRRIGTR